MRAVTAMLLALGIAACDNGGGASSEAQGNAVTAASTNEAAPAEPQSTAAAQSAKPCLFRDTRNWKGSIEGGRLLVTGTLDLQMAGMKPELTERSAGGGTIALDLALTPEAGAAVTDQARYERQGSPRYSAGEIWCGGERIARFDMVNI
jgi:hypothetical protein